MLIIDSRLTDGDGVELCRAIRQSDDQTPIMFYSGLGYEKDKQEAFDAGAQDYLVKPVDISLLVKRLGKLIADSKRHLQVVRTSTARKDSGDLQPAVGVVSSVHLAIMVGRLRKYFVTLAGEGLQPFSLNYCNVAPVIVN